MDFYFIFLSKLFLVYTSALPV